MGRYSYTEYKSCVFVNRGSYTIARPTRGTPGGPVKSRRKSIKRLVEHRIFERQYDTRRFI